MYIERQKAIKELLDVYEYEFPTAHGAFDEFATRLVPSTLKSLPAADVAPVVRGRWDENGSGIIICSECGSGYNLVERYTHYCPNCGAKMDGGKENVKKTQKEIHQVHHPS